MIFGVEFCRCGSEKNVDTSPFRQAIWYYIHSIKGIRHDDYQYRKVSSTVGRVSSRIFIRGGGANSDRQIVGGGGKDYSSISRVLHRTCQRGKLKVHSNYSN